MASRIMEPSRPFAKSGGAATSRSKAPATRTSRPAAAKKKAATPAKSRTRGAAKPAARKAALRKNPLPRVARQSGQTVLVVPLPRIRRKAIQKGAKKLRRAVIPRLRRLTIPVMGMRALAATAFFGAIAYSLMPGALVVLRGIPGTVGDVFRAGLIAQTFSSEVQRWSGEIAYWSEQYGLDANLMATVMQIESCGHPTISSAAGAQGLFQVMPFHFTADESMTDPDTNALRGAGVLKECLRWSNGDVRGALACYNGGPSLVSLPVDSWPAETQRYVVWGEGIYADSQSNIESHTLDTWLRAGGAGLCSAARNVKK